MRVSVVIPDGMVIVDGVGRQVSMAGLESVLHAIQWDGAEGELEYGKPRNQNVAITDFTPYQFLIARWNAAAPPPPPPVIPPTKDDMLDSEFNNPVFKAVILELAEKAGLTEAQLRAAVKARLP